MARFLQFLAFAGVLVFLRGQFLGQSLYVQAETLCIPAAYPLPVSGITPICKAALPNGSNDTFSACIGLAAGEPQEFTGFDFLIAIPQLSDNYAAASTHDSSLNSLYIRFDPSLVSKHIRLQI